MLDLVRCVVGSGPVCRWIRSVTLGRYSPGVLQFAGLKLAMGRLYRELSVFEDAFIVGAFHDELLVECNEGDAETIEKLTVKVMLEAMDELLNAEPPKVRLAAESSVSTAWEKG